MRIEATITFEQYKAALTALRKPAERRFDRRQWLRVTLIVIFSFSFVIAMKIAPFESSSALGFIIALLFLALYFWARYRTHACLKRSFSVQEKQMNGQRMDIDENGISGQWADGNASYQYKWTAFERFIELPDALLFLPNKISFVRIPKASLSPEQQQEIRRLGTSNIQNSR